MTTMGFPNSILAGNVLSIPPDVVYPVIYMTDKVFDGPLVIDGKGAIFTGTIYLPPTLKDVDFINFKFENVKGECFHWGCDQVREGLDNVRFLDIIASNCDSFCIIGTSTDIALETSMSRDIEIGNIVIDDPSKTSGLISICKSVNFYVHDVVVNGHMDEKLHESIIVGKWFSRKFYDNKEINDGIIPDLRVHPHQGGSGQLLSGPIETIYLSNPYILLDANASIDNKKVVSYLWEKTSGPPCSLVELPNPYIGFALAKDMVEGIYQFTLTTTDNQDQKSNTVKTVALIKAPIIKRISIEFMYGPTQIVQII